MSDESGPEKTITASETQEDPFGNEATRNLETNEETPKELPIEPASQQRTPTTDIQTTQVVAPSGMACRLSDDLEANQTPYRQEILRSST